MFHVKHQQGERDAGNTTKERRNKSRVRQKERAAFDIHDRVNYAVTQSSLNFSDESDNIILELTIDTDISPVMSYFEIFMDRMLLCNKAAAYFHKSFGLVVNKQRLL